MKNQDIKPNEKERIALDLFYNRFYDLYKELLGYEPIKYHIELIKKTRPPLEGIIVSDLFSFIRNLLLHFPIFDSWNDVYITKALATKQELFISF